MIVNRNEFVRLTRISGICTWVYKTVELIFWHLYRGYDYFVESLKFVMHHTVWFIQVTDLVLSSIRTVRLRFYDMCRKSLTNSNRLQRIPLYQSVCRNVARTMVKLWSKNHVKGTVRGRLRNWPSWTVQNHGHFLSVAYSSTCMNSCLLNELEPSFEWLIISEIMENIITTIFLLD